MTHLDMTNAQLVTEMNKVLDTIVPEPTLPEMIPPEFEETIEYAVSAKIREYQQFRDGPRPGRQEYLNRCKEFETAIETLKQENAAIKHQNQQKINEYNLKRHRERQTMIQAARAYMPYRLEAVRRIRDALLKESDFTQMADVPFNDEIKEAWVRYRQELRDFPATCDINNPVFPVHP